MKGLWMVRVYPWDTDPADWSVFFDNRADADGFCAYLNATFDHVMLAGDPASTGVTPVYYPFTSMAAAINEFEEEFGNDEE